MKVILKKDFELVGDEGQIIEVKKGYARNFLVPKGIATIATKGNIKNYEEIRKQRKRKIDKQIDEAKKAVSDLAGLLLNIKVKAGEDNKVFGSVTAQMIYDNLLDKGFEFIDRKKIILKDPIKTLGEHEVEIKLQHSVVAKVKVNVTKDSPEEAVINEPETNSEASETESVGKV